MYSVIRVPIILDSTKGVKIQSSGSKYAGDKDKADHQRPLSGDKLTQMLQEVFQFIPSVF